MEDSAPPSSNTNDGIHLFIQPPSMPSATSIIDDSNYDLALTMDRSHSAHLTTLLPDPILRLHSIIGLNNNPNNFLWTFDGNYVLYSASAVAIQMHIESQQQWFFVGHTDRISAMAFDNHSSLLATIQTGENGRIFIRMKMITVMVLYLKAFFVCGNSKLDVVFVLLELSMHTISVHLISEQ